MVRGRVRGRDAGPGLPRPGVRPRGARPRTAASTSTSPPSGCTWTRARWPPASGLPLELTRLHLAGVGGAFGGREDLSMQVHVAMLALRTGPAGEDGLLARGVVLRPRPPPPGADGATSTAPTRDGRLVYVRARIVLDGGAYASSSTAVVANAATFACGPYDVPNARIDAVVAYTNNPPCGAMRGFGAVQVAFAHESQMDRLAAAARRSTRSRSACATRMSTGDAAADRPGGGRPRPGARAAGGAARHAAAARRAQQPGRPARDARRGLQHAPTARTRGAASGFAVGFKNIAFAEGFDDYSTARVRLSPTDEGPLAEIHTAAAEVGQGLRDGARADRAHRAGRRAGACAARRHGGRLGGLDLGLAPDLDDRRRGRRLPARGCASGWPSEPARTCRPDRGDRRLPPPADRAARSRDRAGRLARGPRLRRPPGRRATSTASSAWCAPSRSRPPRTSAAS